MALNSLHTLRFCCNNASFLCNQWRRYFSSQINANNIFQQLLRPAVNAKFDGKRLYCSSNDDGRKSDDDSEDLPPSLRSKFKVFKETDSKVILDFDEKVLLESETKEPKFLYQQRKLVSFGALNTERGEENVFDIEDVVDVLRHEKMNNIAVIRVPRELKYCDYLVIATAKSHRHLAAFVEFFIKLHKKKRRDDDPFLIEEGKASKDWKVLDLGTIVVHVMMQEVRDKYDIEMLWTCGSQFDDLTQNPVYDTSLDLMTKHTKFLDDLTPLK